MADFRSIERFLSANSDMPANPVTERAVQVSPRDKYRPDRIFNRDAWFKWDMILNGIDTPYRLAAGAVVSRIDRTWLLTELEGLKDFEI